MLKEAQKKHKRKKRSAEEYEEEQEDDGGGGGGEGGGGGGRVNEHDMLTTEFVYSLDPIVDFIQQFLIKILASIHCL
jgi:hypothetical protein